MSNVARHAAILALFALTGLIWARPAGAQVIKAQVKINGMI